MASLQAKLKEFDEKFTYGYEPFSRARVKAFLTQAIREAQEEISNFHHHMDTDRPDYWLGRSEIINQIKENIKKYNE